MSEIERTLDDLVSRPRPLILGNVELEVRFGLFTGEREFKSGIEAKSFNRLRTALSREMKEIVTVSTDRIYIGNIRERISDIGGRQESSWIRKHSDRTDKNNVTQYHLRVAYSVEEPLEKQRREDLKLDTIRRKTRYSYRPPGGAAIVELTTVVNVGEKSAISYEVEVEYYTTSLKDYPKDKQLLLAVIHKIYKLIHNTEEMYSMDDVRIVRDDFLAQFKRIFDTDPSESKYPLSFSNSLVPQPRNLHHHDIVFGGLVGGEVTYTTTLKADGERKFLFFHPSGIWMIYPRDNFNRITTYSHPSLTGTILDVEYMPLSKRTSLGPQSKYWVLTLDVVIYKDDISLYYRDHLERMKYVPHGDIYSKSSPYLPGKGVSPYLPVAGAGAGVSPYVAGAGAGISLPSYVAGAGVSPYVSEAGISLPPDQPILTIGSKDYILIDTVPIFYKTIALLSSKGYRDSIGYKVDSENAFIFTPNNTRYNTRSNLIKDLDKRVLTAYPDICKWKEVITIDFSIDRTDMSDIILKVVSDDRKGALIPFVGTQRYPLLPGAILSKSPITDNLPVGTVVEYRWDPIEKMFIPETVRSEKTSPNPMRFAIDNWKLIHNPINLTTLLGTDLILMRKYHNRVKSYLFGNERGHAHLDIGSGAGGDLISKAKNKRLIFAVEPDEKNIAVMKRRLTTAKIQWTEGKIDRAAKVVIIRTGGEDVATITSVIRSYDLIKVDSISIMLSLTFFWESRAKLNSLVETVRQCLKVSGKLLFFTMDGDTFKRVLPWRSSLVTVIHPWDGNPASSATSNRGNAIHITINDTIVTGQVEYLVHLDDFFTLLKGHGYSLRERRRAEGERLLSREELLFSSCFTYGYLVCDRESKVPIPSITPVKAVIPAKIVSGPITPVRAVIPAKIVSGPITPVTPPYGEIRPMIPVEAKDVLSSTWYTTSPGIVRIGVEADGNCLVHAILRGTNLQYIGSSRSERKEIAKATRSDLADKLFLHDPEHRSRNITYWETASNGSYVSFAVMELHTRQTGGELKGLPDSSVIGLANLFSSSCNLGGEIYKYIADILNVNIYVVRAGTLDIGFHEAVFSRDEKANNICINGTGTHYELVGIMDSKGVIETEFPSNHPFIVSMRAKWGLVEPAPLTLEDIDPDTVLVRAILQYFGTGRELIEPDFSKSTERDPLKIRYEMLRERIRLTFRNETPVRPEMVARSSLLRKRYTECLYRGTPDTIRALHRDILLYMKERGSSAPTCIPYALLLLLPCMKR